MLSGSRSVAPPVARSSTTLRLNRRASQWEGLTREQLRAWGQAFPGVNVMAVLAEAAVYLSARPRLPADLDRFLLNQFRRAAMRQQTRRPSSRPPRIPPPPGYEGLARLLQAPERRREPEQVLRIGETLRRARGGAPR